MTSVSFISTPVMFVFFPLNTSERERERKGERKKKTSKRERERDKKNNRKRRRMREKRERNRAKARDKEKKINCCTLLRVIPTMAFQGLYSDIFSDIYFAKLNLVAVWT